MFLPKAVLTIILFALFSLPVYGRYFYEEIDRASQAELRLIARTLGLDPQMNPDDLKDDLLSRFDRTIDDRIDREASVEIRNAQEVRVLEHEGRRVVSFRGDVTLRIIREEDFTLEADLVLFDQENLLLYAHGFVQMDVETQFFGEPFSAESLLFSLADSTAAVADISAVFDHPEEDTYYVSGKEVLLHGSQHLSIRDGVLSTRKEDPYFSVRASHITLMPSGDVVLQGARLHIGRVPVLYLPYFFYPSRTFVFHPVLGYDSERGFFSQNTLYLSGGRDPRDGEETHILRFFQMTDDGKLQREPDWYSLTLSGKEKETEDGFRRILVDVYSGSSDTPAEVFTGYELFTPRAGNFESLRFQAGVSFGKERQALELETPYEAFGGYFDLRARYRKDAFRAGIQLPYMTEREFASNFLNRFEHFSFRHLTNPWTDWPRDYTPQHTLLWKVDASYRNTFPSGSLVDLMHIREFSSSLTWRLTTTDGIRHYSSHTLTAPRLSYRLRGTLFSWEAEREKVPDKHQLGRYALQVQDPFEQDTVKPEDVPDAMRKDRDIPQTREPSPPQPANIKISYDWDHDFSLQFPMQADSPFEEGRIISRLLHRIDSQAKFADSRIDISSALRTRLNYYDRPFGETQAADKSATSVTVLNDFRASLPALGLTYRMDVELFHDRFLYEAAGDRNTRFFAWDKDQFRRHEVFYDHRFRFPDPRLIIDSRFTIQLPPMDPSAAPRLKLSYDPFTLEGETWFGLGEPWEVKEMKGSLTFKPSDSLNVSQHASIDHETKVWKGETRADASLFGIDTDHRFLFGNEYPHNQIGPYRMRVRTDRASLAAYYDWLEEGADHSYGLEHIQFRFSAQLPDVTFWKDRIRFTSGFSAELIADTQQEFLNNFQFDAHFGFRIEEFLSFTFSSSSYNRNPGKYLNDPSSFFTDLRDSFAFFDLDARRASPFNIETYEAELVHYMPDWNFHVSLEGTVKRIDDSWDLVNRLHIYLQWKHIPELRFDERTEFN